MRVNRYLADSLIRAKGDTQVGGTYTAEKPTLRTIQICFEVQAKIIL